MARKKRDVSAKRKSILDAATETFVELGFEKTSMDLVAKRANASKRTVYNHFSSKEALIQEAFNQFLKDAAESKMIKYDPEKSLEDQLDDFAESKMGLTQDPQRLGLMRVTLSAFVNYPELARRAVVFSDSQEDGLVRWLEEATQDGRLWVEDAELAAVCFWSLFSGTFFWPPIVRGPVDPQVGQRLKAEFIELFLARYRNECDVPHMEDGS